MFCIVSTNMRCGAFLVIGTPGIFNAPSVICCGNILNVLGLCNSPICNESCGVGVPTVYSAGCRCFNGYFYLNSFGFVMICIVSTNMRCGAFLVIGTPGIFNAPSVIGCRNILNVFVLCNSPICNESCGVGVPTVFGTCCRCFNRCNSIYSFGFMVLFIIFTRAGRLARFTVSRPVIFRSVPFVSECIGLNVGAFELFIANCAVINLILRAVQLTSSIDNVFALNFTLDAFANYRTASVITKVVNGRIRINTRIH